ncbi:MAG: carboxypeptidase-like regulatory domain-containing protein [Candidatus Moduliflexus flocculans]|nr:carboxypeptidase-like regulatory domain-containing protein [Candidatus Moduliflexus flocculans]
MRHLVAFPRGLALAAGLISAWPSRPRPNTANTTSRAGSSTAKKNPLAGVSITLRDQGTSRSLVLKTKKDGSFKYVGLPHGLYQVVFRKEGFAEKTDEWKFQAPQDQMLKVEIPPVVMVSQDVLAEAEKMQKAAADVKAAAEKVRRPATTTAPSPPSGPILEKNPKDSNALYILGMACQKKAQWPEAERGFPPGPGADPELRRRPLPAGRLLTSRRAKPTRPWPPTPRAMELDPANPDSAYNSGLILFGQVAGGRGPGPVRTGPRPSGPDDPAFLEMAGRCHINLAAVRKPDGAIEIDKSSFEKALAYLEKAKVRVRGRPGQDQVHRRAHRPGQGTAQEIGISPRSR